MKARQYMIRKSSQTEQKSPILAFFTNEVAALVSTSSHFNQNSRQASTTCISLLNCCCFWFLSANILFSSSAALKASIVAAPGE